MTKFQSAAQVSFSSAAEARRTRGLPRQKTALCLNLSVKQAGVVFAGVFRRLQHLYL
jgi:hypothetical protein